MDGIDPAGFWILDEYIDDNSIDEPPTGSDHITGIQFLADRGNNGILDVLQWARYADTKPKNYTPWVYVPDDTTHRRSSLEEVKRKQPYSLPDNASEPAKRKKVYPSSTEEFYNNQFRQNRSPQYIRSPSNTAATHTTSYASTGFSSNSSNSSSSPIDNSALTRVALDGHHPQSAKAAQHSNHDTSNITITEFSTASQPPLLPRQSREDPRKRIAYYKQNKYNNF